MKLKNKVAVITGSAKGIGKAIAQEFAKEGARVVINSRHMDDIKKTVDEIKKAGGEAIGVEADVSKLSDVKKMLKKTVDSFGGIDILVNNAGVAHFDPLTEISEKEWDTTIDVNLKGCFMCSKEAVVEMLKTKTKGIIINLASIAGEVGFQNLAHYCASKGGIIEMTKEMALELAPKGIRVNAIGPGVIDTDMTKNLLKDPEAKKGLLSQIPLGRVGKPEEIAKVALFLASDDSSYMTGSTVFVDGGWLTR